MLLNYKDTRILILPKILNKNIKFGQTQKLMPGVNEIDSDYWVECKKHKSIKKKLDNGMIKEITQTVSEANVKKIRTDITKEIEEIEKLKEESKQKKQAKKKSRKKEEKELLQDEIDEIDAELEEAQESIDTKNKKILDSISDFSKLPHSQKEALIKECYDLETLNKWGKEDDKADIRNIILNRIEEIKKNKK